jgi:uncharacterized damage-inducible protein DinB
MKVRTLLPCLLVALALPALARQPRNAVQNTAASPRAMTGFHADFHAQLDEVEHKIVGLAEATPADKYGWRPAGDIRSISEVYMHIAGWNYFLSSFLGAAAPSYSGDYEKRITKKAEVVAELKKSFAHLRAAVDRTSDLDRQVKMMGSTTTSRGVMMTMLNHLHEHLGQSIAYARMNAVVPPWSH